MPRHSSFPREFSAEAAIASVPALDAAAIDQIYAKAAVIIDAAQLGDESADIDSARVLLQTAAAGGHVDAIGRLGRWHLFGLYGVPRDLRRALLLLYTAAMRDDPTACYWLGHALSKLSDLVAQEQALQAAVAAASAGVAGVAPATSGSSSSSLLTSIPSSSSPAPSFPDPSRDESEADLAGRVERAQAVILEIRELRKRNRLMKASKKGEAGSNIETAVDTTTTSAFPSTSSSTPGLFDPSLLPLKSHTALAYAWLVRAAAFDHADAQVALGNVCMSWEGAGAGPERVREAISWYELAAKEGGGEKTGTGDEEGAAALPTGLGHPDAQYNLGMVYWEGVEGVVECDPVRALSLFQCAADQGDASALMFLGHLYRTGSANANVRPNVRKCLRYLEQASSAGHGGASHYLAQLWREGDGFIALKPNAQRSHFFLKLACEADVPEAWAEMGDVLLRGNGREREKIDGAPEGEVVGIDLPRALHAYEMAGSLGHASALVSAGAMYYQGLGAPSSPSTAADRYRSAGELGSPEGWDNLAALHATGAEGVPQSLQAARSYAALAERLRTMQKADSEGKSCGTPPSFTDTRGADVSQEGGSGGCGKSSCACKST